MVFQCLAFHKALLNSTICVLVFHPLKALAEDQLCGWQKMAKSLGFPDKIIGRIDGSVPVRDRGSILQDARIVIMTPDVSCLVDEQSGFVRGSGVCPIFVHADFG